MCEGRPAPLGASSLPGWQAGAVNDRLPEEHVVVAGLLRRRGRALMVHRSPQREWYPDAWDLPGGHVIAGEAPRHALARELDEELGVVADVAGEPFAGVQGADFHMDIWVIDQWTGEPFNRDAACSARMPCSGSPPGLASCSRPHFRRRSHRPARRSGRSSPRHASRHVQPASHA